MLITSYILFFAALLVMTYLLVSKEKKITIEHQTFEAWLLSVINKIKMFSRYVNKKTAILFFHFFIDSIEKGVLKTTSTLKKGSLQSKKFRGKIATGLTRKKTGEPTSLPSEEQIIKEIIEEKIPEDGWESKS